MHKYTHRMHAECVLHNWMHASLQAARSAVSIYGISVPLLESLSSWLARKSPRILCVCFLAFLSPKIALKIFFDNFCQPNFFFCEFSQVAPKCLGRKLSGKPWPNRETYGIILSGIVVYIRIHCTISSNLAKILQKLLKTPKNITIKKLANN